MEQYDRYIELCRQAPERHEQLKPYYHTEDLSPFWVDGVRKAWSIVSPCPPFEFMRRPALRGRLGTRPDRAAAMGLWLDETLAKGEAEKALVVDKVGGMEKTTFRGIAVSLDVMKFLYYATIFTKSANLPLASLRSILEWGGGYGAQAKVFKRLGRKNLTYTIVDLVPMCLLQWVYLSVLFGEDQVNLLTKKEDSVTRGQINIIPASLAMEMSTEALGSPHLFISINALNECPVHVARPVVEERDWFSAKRVLLRIMHGRIPDGDGFYNLREASDSFGRGETVQGIRGPVPLIVRER